MLEKFADYLKEIEMADAFRDRAEKLCTDFILFLPNEIENVIVTDGYDGSGARKYQSLWLYSQNLIMESKNFLTSDNIDFLDLRCGVRWLQIDKKDLDFASGTTSINSRLTVDVVFGEGANGAATARLEAAHSNCLRLASFVREVLPPRISAS